MLKKTPTLVASLLLALVFSLNLQAASAQRIAVLDLQEALLATDRVSRAFAQIDEELRSDEARIRQLAEEGRSLQQRLQRDADIMSDSERTRLSREMQQKVQEYQQRSGQLQQHQQQRRQQVINEQRPGLEKIVNELLEEHQIDILLDRQAAHFAKPQFDLTPLVADRLNKEE